MEGKGEASNTAAPIQKDSPESTVKNLFGKKNKFFKTKTTKGKKYLSTQWLHQLRIFYLNLNHKLWASLIAQLVKNLPAMQATWAQFLGQEDPLEKGMATHSSILA